MFVKVFPPLLHPLTPTESSFLNDLILAIMKSLLLKKAQEVERNVATLLSKDVKIRGNKYQQRKPHHHIAIAYMMKIDPQTEHSDYVQDGCSYEKGVCK